VYLHTTRAPVFTCVRRKVNKFSLFYSDRSAPVSLALSFSIPSCPFSRTRAHMPWGQVLKLLSGFRLARSPIRSSVEEGDLVVNLAPCKIEHYCPLLRIVYQCIYQYAQRSTYVTARECIQVLPSVQDALGRCQLNFSSLCVSKLEAGRAFREN